MIKFINLIIYTLLGPFLFTKNDKFKMDYFEYINYDIIEIIISYLNFDEFKLFTKSYNNLINHLDWNKIFYFRFNYYYSSNLEKYRSFIAIEKLSDQRSPSSDLWSPFSIEDAADITIGATIKSMRIDFGTYYIRDLYNIKSIDLYGMNIKEIPDEMCYLENLHFLDIGRNPIIYISPEMYNLTNLASLRICGTNLGHIPISIFNIKSLTSLNLVNNKIKKIPDKIENLFRLENLDISNNLIKYIPKNIKWLYNLKVLNISHNKLKFLPEEVELPSQLKLRSIRDAPLHSMNARPRSMIA